MEVSNAQEELNKKAFEASLAGDFEKAVQLLEASLRLGELNVTYLNLGRAHAKLHRCIEAQKAYKQTLDAPFVKTPSKEQVTKVLDDYMQELLAECGAEVHLMCAEGLEISVDEGPPRACSALPLTLFVGEHTLTAKQGTRSKTIRFVAVKDQVTEVNVAVDEDNEVIGPQGPMSKLQMWGWIVGGSGVAILLTGAILDAAVLGPMVSDFEAAAERGDKVKYDELEGSIGSTQAVVIAAYAIGGSALLAGGAMLVYDLFIAEEPTATALTPIIAPDQLGLGLTLRW